MKKILRHVVVPLLILALNMQIVFATDSNEYKIMARGGDAKAMFELGVLYEEGIGIVQNYVQAHMWYNISSSLGYVKARKARDAIAGKMTKEQVAKAQEYALNWKPSQDSKTLAGGEKEEGKIFGNNRETEKNGDIAGVKALLKLDVDSKKKDQNEISGLLSGNSTEAFKDMEFVFIKGGCFDMGDVFEEGGVDESPVHRVCVDDFYMGKTEVTQKQWIDVMGYNPSRFKGGNDLPVERVSWNKVQEFIKILNQKAGVSFRLPTETEWEYAARNGGKKEKWAGTSSESELGEYAWHRGNSNARTHPAGEKMPNGLGLYDMTGNVWEWCSDWYDKGYYKNSPGNNPKGPLNGSFRVIRGGSWLSRSSRLRTMYRGSYSPNSKKYSNIGFRLVRTP
ncbi:MAG: SUMF1/EgtB/PvdO family nonheme iron enzyme [Candidatus Brocadiaceae bacterium]|nr:SUMF1/EgtB/PvdO family nonheme iron enzyme [Candidatus Brocadiaceae bacterium]